MIRKLAPSILSLLLGIWLGTQFLQKQATHPLENYTVVPTCDQVERMVFRCSMHPHVQQKKQGHCPICRMPLAQELATTSRSVTGEGRPGLIQFGKAEILTEKVSQQKEIKKEIRLFGVVEVDESRVYSQVAHLPGRIEKLYVNQSGQQVKKGDPIASIYSKDLIAVREALVFNRQSESVMRAARNNLANWKISEGQLQVFESEEVHHQPIDIFADFSGIVLRKLTNEGDYAGNSHMGQPTVLYEVADLSSLWVVFSIENSDRSWFKEGQYIKFWNSEDPKQQYGGKVSFIDPTVDPANRYFKLRLEVNNPIGLLQPGMPVESRQVVSQHLKERLLTVPKTAVLWTGPRSVVYVKAKNEKGSNYALRKVLLGKTIGTRYEIVEGLEEGEEVVTYGVFTIDATAQLAGEQSMMNHSTRQNGNE